jgi:hypothetical protein
VGWIEQNVNQDIIDYLFNIKIHNLPNNLGSYQKNVAPDLKISFDMLEEQLEETPEMVAFWNMLLAEQRFIVSAIEKQIRATRGSITEKLIERAKQENIEFRSTEIRELINSDTSLQQWENKLITAQKAEERLKVVCEALKMKFDALRSLSGFKKVEKNQA